MKIEGKNPVFEVLNSGLNIDKLLIQSNFLSLKRKKVMN